MKKKQFMSKLAALTIAATMTLSTGVPVFAASEAVPASNAAITANVGTDEIAKQISYSIVTSNGTISDAEKKDIQTLAKQVNNGKSNNGIGYNTGTANNYWKADKTAVDKQTDVVKKALEDEVKTYTVESNDGGSYTTTRTLTGGTTTDLAETAPNGDYVFDGTDWVDANGNKATITGLTPITGDIVTLGTGADGKRTVTQKIAVTPQVKVAASVKNGTYTYGSGKFTGVVDSESVDLTAADYTITPADYTPVNGDKITVSSYVAPKSATLAGAIISEVTVTDADNWGFTITDANGVQAKVTVKTGHSYTLVSDVTDLLDQYFENTDYTTYGGKSITTQQVAKDLNADTAKSYKDAYGNLTTISKALSSYGITISGSSDLVKDAKGEITAKAGSKEGFKTDGEATATDPAKGSEPSIKYSFTINETKKSEDEDTALKNAIASINGSTYADPGNKDKLVQRLTADLIAAGAPKEKINLAAGKYTAAKATEDGNWYITLDDNVFKVILKYSSASKLSDTDKAVRKALVGSEKSGSADFEYTIGTVDEHEDAMGRIYKYAANSTFSKALQATGATKAVKLDAVKAAVEKAVTDSLTAEKVADNGVKVEEVNALYPASTPATSTEPGNFYFVITASIRNDFFGWKDGTQPTTSDVSEKTSKINYLVHVETGKLKLVETTGLELADKTVEFVPNATPNRQTGRLTGMVVSIDPTVTPEGGNDELVYTIKDQKGNVVQQSDQQKAYAKATGYVDKDGKYVPLNDNEFLFGENQGGKYIVEVKVKDNEDIKASATLTLKDSFNDALDNTKYYRDAVRWAYQTKISSGIGNDTFGVNQTVTRGEFVTWLYNLASKAGADVDVDASASKFTDVNANAYYAKAVAWATQNGIVAGTSATTFSPNAEVTRGQIATFLYRLNGSNVNITSGNSQQDATVNFTDIAGSYYTTSITWAAQRDIVSGKTATTFAPNDKASRKEAITILSRANSKLGINVY